MDKLCGRSADAVILDLHHAWSFSHRVQHSVDLCRNIHVSFDATQRSEINSDHACGTASVCLGSSVRLRKSTSKSCPLHGFFPHFDPLHQNSALHYFPLVRNTLCRFVCYASLFSFTHGFSIKHPYDVSPSIVFALNNEA